jgi:hypothetical protein
MSARGVWCIISAEFVLGIRLLLLRALAHYDVG